MNLNTYNRKAAILAASRLTNLTGRPVKVFRPYMPSVYPVDHTPFFMEKMPGGISEEQWRLENRQHLIVNPEDKQENK